MRRLLLDTNAYVAFKRGDPAAVEILRQADEITVPAIVLGELLAGFACGGRDAANRLELTAFLDAPRVRTVAIDDDTAPWYARAYAGLRRAGRPIPTNDLWIAALALQHGLPLFTLDEHFQAVDGLMAVARPEDLMP